MHFSWVRKEVFDEGSLEGSGGEDEDDVEEGDRVHAREVRLKIEIEKLKINN